MSENGKLERTHGTKQTPEQKDSGLGRFRTCTGPFLSGFSECGTDVGDAELFRNAHCPSVLVHTGPRTLTGYQELQCKYAWWIRNIFVNFI